MDNIHLVLADFKIIDIIRNVLFYSPKIYFIDLNTKNTTYVSTIYNHVSYNSASGIFRGFIETKFTIGLGLYMHQQTRSIKK